MPHDDDHRHAGIEQLADELGTCRQRGLEWLDDSGRKREPVVAPMLTELARRYITGQQLTAAGRQAQIKILLRRAVDEMVTQRQSAEARLVRDLFFGDQGQAVIMRAGELLDLAKKGLGEITETRYREIRGKALHEFAMFLLEFVDEVDPLPDTVDGGTHSDHDEQSGRLSVTTGYVGEREDRFVELLAAAIRVTIIGHTHAELTTALANAMARKRAQQKRPDAFWRSLNIVFLSDTLLGYVNDERDTSPDPAEAIRDRRRAVTWGRRSVRFLLKHTNATHWTLYESLYLPPLAGTLFEMSDGRHFVQLLIRRPETSTSDNLYFEFEDPDGYFSGVFNDVLRHSINENKAAVPTGSPVGATFECRGRHWRQDVLRDGNKVNTWLPMVLIVTTLRRRGQILPMLQLRTKQNAVRELDKVSHLSNHIFLEDYSRSFEKLEAPACLDLTSDWTLRAAQRRVLMETGDDTPPDLRPVTTGIYLNHDKEDLMFFVYTLKLPSDFDVDLRSEMHPFPVPELIAIRANHALRSALALCRHPGMPRRLWTLASEIVALNLTMHGYAGLSQQLQDPKEDLSTMASRFEQLVAETACTCTSFGNDIVITGLSGWQYREFFTVLLPLYAELGVQDASRALEAFEHSDDMLRVRTRLAELYRDEDLIRAIPLEL